MRGDPRTAADAAEVVITSLPGTAVLETVALEPDGIAAGAAPILVDLSTTGPAMAKRVAAGTIWADSPVSGRVRGATNGTLALIISCPTDTLAAIRPILETFGRIFVVGDAPGLAQAVKLGDTLWPAP